MNLLSERDIGFQSTRPTRDRDTERKLDNLMRSLISIHAAHEGPRLGDNVLIIALFGISIHAAHEGPRRAVTV